MKKLFMLSSVLLGTMVMIGFSGVSEAKAQHATDTPSGVIKMYTDLIIKEDYVAAVLFLADADKAPNEEVELFAEILRKELEKKGGLKSCRILGEEILQDGNKARVKVIYTWGDGTSKEFFEHPIKTEKGWRCTL